MIKVDVFKVFIATLVVTLVAFLAYIIPKDIERDNRAQEIAKEMGCEYIGSARDLGSIKFLDCNGEVKAIRVQRK